MPRRITGSFGVPQQNRYGRPAVRMIDPLRLRQFSLHPHHLSLKIFPVREPLEVITCVDYANCSAEMPDSERSDAHLRECDYMVFEKITKCGAILFVICESGTKNARDNFSTVHAQTDSSI